jgi:molybdate transport system substrate-binding protein
MRMRLSKTGFALRRWAAALAVVLLAGAANAGTVLVAVAANFAGAAEAIAAGFSQASGHSAVITTGATGKLYAQIVEGAPFEVLLSADSATPARLEADGLAVAGAGFTYAVGGLTLWSADAGRIGADPKMALSDPELRFVAIANPDLAPYGLAAREALQRMGLWDGLQERIVQGQNIGQAFGLVQTGAAELGFVARSALDVPGAEFGGSRWDVPQALFAPLRQDAALLSAGANNPAAVAFMAYLAGDDARAVIEAYGYGLAE